MKEAAAENPCRSLLCWRAGPGQDIELRLVDFSPYSTYVGLLRKRIFGAPKIDIIIFSSLIFIFTFSHKLDSPKIDIIILPPHLLYLHLLSHNSTPCAFAIITRRDDYQNGNNDIFTWIWKHGRLWNRPTEHLREYASSIWTKKCMRLRDSVSECSNHILWWIQGCKQRGQHLLLIAILHISQTLLWHIQATPLTRNYKQAKGMLGILKCSSLPFLSFDNFDTNILSHHMIHPFMEFLLLSFRTRRSDHQLSEDHRTWK